MVCISTEFVLRVVNECQLNCILFLTSRYYCAGGAKHRAWSESGTDDKGRGGVQPGGVRDRGGQGFCGRQSGAISKYIVTDSIILFILFINGCVTIYNQPEYKF